MLPKTSGHAAEIIMVRAGGDERIYAGLGGTFTVLADSLCHQQTLPGFDSAGLLDSAFLHEKRLSVIICKQPEFPDLWTVLDVAMKNAGAFPYSGKSPSEFVIEAYLDLTA